MQLHGLTGLELGLLGTLTEQALEGSCDVGLAHDLLLLRLLLRVALLTLRRLRLNLACRFFDFTLLFSNKLGFSLPLDGFL